VQQLLSVVRKVAATDAAVLLRGESGTGKELLARAVHDTSPRAGKPYVKVHCAALSASLLESELFGHVKGAFTGAHKDKVGRFELADAGTLFLDEIGDISLDVQTKLLRVLQERTIERVGSSESLKVDVRIIAATHQNLEELIRQGRFREDLFYRLNVFPIAVPPLRDRREDIPELAVYFIEQSAQRCKKGVTNIDDDALALLKSQSWPGNIRQLENCIERAVVIAEAPTLTLADMPVELLAINGETLAPTPAPATVRAEPVLASSLRSERDRFEREQLLRALAAAAGNKAEAARALGIARSTLVSRMKKLDIE
jgi:transcriptional regulator with GAF, ATPase, and Fis domain